MARNSALATTPSSARSASTAAGLAGLIDVLDRADGGQLARPRHRSGRAARDLSQSHFVTAPAGAE